MTRGWGAALAHARTGSQIGLKYPLTGRPDQAAALAVAALAAGGIGAIDTALGGIGGCPFAQDDLIGNLATELVWPALQDRGVKLPVVPRALGGLAKAARDLAADHD